MVEGRTPPAPIFTPFVWPWQLRPEFRRRWRRYWIDDPIFGIGYFLIHHGARPLPIAWASAIGAGFGWLSWRFGHKADRVRIGLIYRALTDARPEEVERVVRGLFIHLGRVALEYSMLDRLWARGRITVAGAEHLANARAGGRPLIVMGMHLGNWEVIAPTLIGLGLREAQAFYQPRRSRFETRILVAARERYGITLLRPGAGAARAARRLLVEERGVLLVYADEERNRRVSAPRFGRALPGHANLRDIVRLAQASGALVLPTFVERLPGARFRQTFLAPIDLTAEDPAAAIDRLDATIEAPILAHLDQWYMLTEETVAIAGPDWRRATPAAGGS